MNKFYAVILGIFLSSPVFGQDLECRKPTDKKVIKLLDQAKKSKDDREKLTILKDAIAIDDECAPCLYELGMRAFKKANEDNTSYMYAEKYFKQLAKVCPKYHSDTYYYLGVIAYSQEDFTTTITRFKEFIGFKITEDDQAGEDYMQKVKNVKQILPEIEFYANFFSKPVPFNPIPVPNVCTQQSEYLPMISPDNELMFFTRRFYRKALGDLTEREVEEFTMAQRKDIHSDFDAGTKLPPPFNTGPGFGGATISVNNKEMIICACMQEDPKSSVRDCDLYSTKYEKVFNMNTQKYEYKWSALENLGPNINEPKHWEAQPSLSSDGKTLFFTRLQKESQGIPQNYDIMYSTRGADGKWSRAVPVPGISTPTGNEKTPFMHSDSKTLYFSAEVNENYWGAGGYDIFYTKQNENGTWSKPKNIGYPINTENDELGLIVSTDGRLAYYSSGLLKNGKGGHDIFYFEIPVEARPEKVVIVKGQVKDENGDPLQNAKIEITYTNSDKKEEVQVDKDDGTYVAVVNVDKGNDAIVTVKAEDRTFDSKLIAANTPEPVVKNADLKSEKIEVGKAYTIDDILFETNSFELNAQSKFVIEQFVVFLKENPKIKIAIHGHTDDRGIPQENQTLSENRAKAVMDYIVMKGISETRIQSEGFGQSKPKVPNTSDENRALNRRTEFVILSK